MYETPETIKKERDIADILEKSWGCKLYKMHFKLSVDFAICTDCIKGWVEVKTRTISSKHNDKYMISLHKIKSCRDLAKETKLPFILVVKFTDGIYYYKDNGEDHLLKIGGRVITQRDAQDIEPCYYIDMNLFKKL
jgi:hypothetical protein